MISPCLCISVGDYPWSSRCRGSGACKCFTRCTAIKNPSPDCFLAHYLSDRSITLVYFCLYVTPEAHLYETCIEPSRFLQTTNWFKFAVPVDTIYCCLPVHYIGFISHLYPSNILYIFYLPVATCTSHARNQIPHLLYILWCFIFLNLPNTLNRNRITPPSFYYNTGSFIYGRQSFNKILPSSSIIELCI